MKKVFVFHQDPGHGWLQVEKQDCERVGFCPTQYSYMGGGYLYLEEDLDAPLFLAKWKEAGLPYGIQELPQTKRESPIRNLAKAK